MDRHNTETCPVKHDDLEEIHCSFEKIAEMLDGTEWADGFSWEQMNRIAKHVRALKAGKGTFVFQEGATDNSMCIIVKGRVNVVKADMEDHDSVLAVLGPGKTFGEMSLIDGQPRSAHVIAASDVIILMITETGLHDLAEHAPGLGMKILWKICSVISRRLRRTSGLLVEYISDEE